MLKKFVFLFMLMVILSTGCVKKTEIKNSIKNSPIKEQSENEDKLLPEEPIPVESDLIEFKIGEIKSSEMESFELRNSISGAQIDDLEFDLADVSLPIPESEVELKVPVAGNEISFDSFSY